MSSVSDSAGSVHREATTDTVPVAEASKVAGPTTAKTTRSSAVETPSVPRLHSPVATPRTHSPMPRLHSSLSPAALSTSAASTPSAKVVLAAMGGIPTARRSQTPPLPVPVPRIKTRTGSSNLVEPNLVPQMGKKSLEKSTTEPVTPLSPGAPGSSMHQRPLSSSRSSVLPPLETKVSTIQPQPIASRRLSREEIINRMEFEQDALVVRLLREINDLKQENARLRYQLKRLQRNKSSENLGVSAATGTVTGTGTGSNYPQYLHEGPNSLESVAVLDDTDRRRSIAASSTSTATAGGYGNLHAARSIQATFGIPMGYPKTQAHGKARESFGTASSASAASVVRRRNSISHDSIYPIEVHRASATKHPSLTTTTTTTAAILGSGSTPATPTTATATTTAGNYGGYSAQRKSIRSSSVHMMEGVGGYSLNAPTTTAAGRDTSAARLRR